MTSHRLEYKPTARSSFLTSVILLATLFVYLHSSVFRSQAARTDQSAAVADSGGEEQVANIPYFVETEEFHSTLILNNNQTEEKTATITLFNMHGEPWAIPAINLKPRQIFRLSLGELLEHAPQDFRSGNIQIIHHGLRFDVMAQITIVSKDERLSFESIRTAAPDFVMSRLDGISWVPDDETEAKVALTNTAGSKLNVTVIGGRKQEKRISLTPRETRLVNLREFAGEIKDDESATLVTLEHDGAPGALIATGFALNRRTGFSSNLTFADCGTAKSMTLAGAHIRLGRPDPGEGFPADTSFSAPLLVANTMDKPVSAQVFVEYTIGGQPARLELTPISLSARQVKQMDLLQELEQRGITGVLDDAGVDITYDGMPGTVIGRLTSYDRSKEYTFDVPIKDPQGGPSNGSYPWRLDGGYTTVLHLKNTSDKEVTAMYKLIYDGGEYNPAQIRLGPYQTIAIDFRSLRDDQKKDLRDAIMPNDVEFGKVTWIGGEPESVIIGRAEVANIRTGIASSFSCNGCECSGAVMVTNDPAYSPFLSPGGLTVPVNASGVFFGAFEYMETFCNNDVWGPESVSANWSSGDPNLASVSGQTITALRPGSVQISASWQAVVAYGYSCAPQTGGGGASATLNVRPTITSITPARGVEGATTRVTISGAGFTSGATINAGSGATASIVSVDSSNSITADFAVDGSVNAVDGPVAVTVTVNGQISNSDNTFFHQVARHLAPLDNPLAPNGIAPLQTPVDADLLYLGGQVAFSHFCGVGRNYLFSLTDQENQEITNRPFVLNEEFSNYSGSWSTPTFMPLTFPSGSEVADLISRGVQGQGCTQIQPGMTESFTQGFQITFGNTVFVLDTLIQHSRGNFGGTLKVDRTITVP